MRHGHRVVFSFGWEGNATNPPGSSRVEISLECDGKETLVRLVHRDLPNTSSRDEHAKGWTHYTSRLALAASGKDPGADPWAKLMDEQPPATL